MHGHPVSVNWIEVISQTIPFALFIALYIVAVYFTNKKFRKWPNHRIVCWGLGIICIALATIGPIAKAGHSSFTAHMISHLLLGMLGPLLLVFSAPLTLMLRTLPIKFARTLTKLLKSRYVGFVSHPVTATILNIGGLWVLYTTELFQAMHHFTFIFAFVHFHVFLAGYVFTISMIYIDSTPHKKSFTLRATVLVVAMAGHGILSKWIYANPPTGVKRIDAEMGGMTMYYGGDAIDLIIVIALCYQYFMKSHKNKVENKPILN